MKHAFCTQKMTREPILPSREKYRVILTATNVPLWKMPPAQKILKENLLTSHLYCVFSNFKENKANTYMAVAYLLFHMFGFLCVLVIVYFVGNLYKSTQKHSVSWEMF